MPSRRSSLLAPRPRSHDVAGWRGWIPATALAIVLTTLVVGGTVTAEADPSAPPATPGPAASSTVAAPDGSAAPVPGGSATGGAGAAPAQAGPADCADLTSRYAGQVPAGWRIECVEAFPATWRGDAADSGVAMSSRSEKRIAVRTSTPAGELESAVAHEVAHAESSAWPAALRTAVAQAMGEQSWAGGGGPATPMEVFAESAVRCRGLATRPEHPLVPCELVEAARSAGGATAPLPVSGTHPRG